MNTIVKKYLLSSAAFDADKGGAPGGDKGGAPGGDKGGAPGGDKGGAPGGGGDKPFYADHVKDPDNIKFIADRKFDSFDTILKSGRSADELARSRNVLPKPDPTKLADWEGHEALGWVKDRTKYVPKAPTAKEGQVYDPTMFNDFVELAHQHRVPVAAAEGIYNSMFEKMQGRIAEMTTAEQGKATKAKADLDTALKGEWGTKYDENSTMARRAWRALGVDDKASGELEKIMGAPGLVKLGHRLGTMLGEDTLAKGGGGGEQQTAEQVDAEIRRMQADPTFITAINDPRHPQHADVVGRRQKLIEQLAKLQGRQQAA